jgi:hypothetical protein
MTAKTYAALQASKTAIGALLVAIEQHHATSLCASAALFAEADRQYRVLDVVRDALHEGGSEDNGND